MILAEELTKILSSDQVTQNLTILQQHSQDESFHEPHLPDVVVFPKSSNDVSRILSFANEHRIPVVPFGAGSGLEGHAIPVQGGITLDFALMNRILKIYPSDFCVKVQPGVTRLQLNKELKKYGLFFSVDPGADATLGGMAATNASGTTAVRYGIMRDQVRDLEVVLADGRTIHTGGQAAKSSSGYNLNGLFTGSEGTLGVFTELTLKVYGIPECVMAARAAFPTVKQALNTATSILTAGIPIAKMELVDSRSILQMNRFQETDYPVMPTLFLEFHGNDNGLEQETAFTRLIAEEQACVDFIYESDSKERKKLWEARHHLSYAFRHGSPGKHIEGTDVCVPLSCLADSIEHARKKMEEADIDGAVIGHIGDGNYHTLLVIDPDDPNDRKQAHEINKAIVEFALQHGGTCTGEHGVGLGKIRYQRAEHGNALDVMMDLKRLLDPNHILNPGKLFPMKSPSSININ
ncbi:FAD-binding oxidoreductase [Fictibacillus sp. FJAT-27399]|uniref:FAD-binding oxidoreductase n=1 Tax=Fictibacillus sp. FJAT-27399 TaxID=1729689 RepID=UPI000782313C|nr:FAD-linked oxidase C-terminal domain-containing protein [Fictibacillus sp. FJAT-27399]